jgi:hypothetical protein
MNLITRGWKYGHNWEGPLVRDMFLFTDRLKDVAVTKEAVRINWQPSYVILLSLDTKTNVMDTIRGVRRTSRHDLISQFRDPLTSFTEAQRVTTYNYVDSRG